MPRGRSRLTGGYLDLAGTEKSRKTEVTRRVEAFTAGQSQRRRDERQRDRVRGAVALTFGLPLPDGLQKRHARYLVRAASGRELASNGLHDCVLDMQEIVLGCVILTTRGQHGLG
jgi:hypothetical protein